ncbi:MAG: bifunctional DNA primase/polymerase [Nitrosopumilaceae archaeon]|nr:bifunctional DNA primase/polymerase [Nitrosopumilaceae archaeon]
MTAKDSNDGPRQTASLSAPAEAARLRKLGFNIIPIKQGTKVPRASANENLRWRADGCDTLILKNDSIAMLHGDAGKTWALDCDDPSILDDLLKDLMEYAEKLCVVRTPKYGHHIIFKVDGASLPPPRDLRYMDNRGRMIDVKSSGCTLLPPSTYPDEQFGIYEYLFETNAPRTSMRWGDVLNILHRHGFFSRQ